MQFDLLTNPFAVLGLTGDASAGAIAARVRDLGTPDAAAAGRTLLAPRTRLHAELCFLPGVDTLTGMICLDNLRAGREPDLWALPPPARANVLAHLASHGQATARHLQSLVGLQEAIRPSVAEAIDQARVQARMPPAPREMLDAGVVGLADLHASAFAAGMLALPNGADLFAEQLDAIPREATAAMAFLRHSGAAWDRATTSQAVEDLETAMPIEAILGDHPDPSAAAQLAEIVLRFAKRTTPGRQARRLVGLPHASMEPAQRWRALAIDLNNRQDAVPEAVTILEALATGFGTTDELGARIATDLNVCRKRLARGEGTAQIRRLVKAIENAIVHELSFQRCGIVNGRTTAQTPAVVVELYDAFVAAVGASCSHLPWRLVRELTLRLHSEFSATEAAHAFTCLAVEHGGERLFAADIVRELKSDLRVLRRHLVSAELAAAMKAKQTRQAKRLFNELITLTDDADERANLRDALDRLAWQKTVLIKYWYVGFALIVAIFATISNGHSPALSRGAIYTDTYKQAPASTTPNTPAAVAPDNGHPELQPAPGTATLTQSELRWCRFQHARARAANDYLESFRLVDGLDVDRFNASVQAYNAFIAPMNSGCASYKYLPADGAVIDAELLRDAARLRAEGQAILVTGYSAADIPATRQPPRGSLPDARDLPSERSNKGLPGAETLLGARPQPSSPGFRAARAFSSAPADRPATTSPPSDSRSPAPSSAATDLTAYAQGRTDRQNWEFWFSGLSGAFRDGADWWSGVRNTPHPLSCERAPGVDHVVAVSGCTAAKSRLDNVDRRRRAEPDYRAGWNSP